MRFTISVGNWQAPVEGLPDALEVVKYDDHGGLYAPTRSVLERRVVRLDSVPLDAIVVAIIGGQRYKSTFRARAPRPEQVIAKGRVEGLKRTFHTLVAWLRPGDHVEVDAVGKIGVNLHRMRGRWFYDGQTLSLHQEWSEGVRPDPSHIRLPTWGADGVKGAFPVRTSKEVREREWAESVRRAKAADEKIEADLTSAKHAKEAERFLKREAARRAAKDGGYEKSSPFAILAALKKK